MPKFEYNNRIRDYQGDKPFYVGPLMLPLLKLKCKNRFYVVGNHEYYHGNNNKVKPWEAYFREALNFRVLHNEVHNDPSQCC